MREDLLFGKLAVSDMTAVNFNNSFYDGMVEMDRGHLQVFPKLWNLQNYVRRTVR